MQEYAVPLTLTQNKLRAKIYLKKNKNSELGQWNDSLNFYLSWMRT
jgi:hypothetical protein